MKLIIHVKALKKLSEIMFEIIFVKKNLFYFFFFHTEIILYVMYSLMRLSYVRKDTDEHLLSISEAKRNL